MIFTAKQISLGRLLVALLLALCLLLGNTALAQSATTLTVQVKGVVYDPASGWHSVTLSAPVDVYSADGKALGQVTAGAAQGAALTDTLDVSGVSDVVLKPAEGAQIDGFAFAGEARAAVTAGQKNLATVFAYAQQGLYRVTNVLAGSGESVAGAEFAVLDANGEVQASFVTDETGSYLAEALLPCGSYQLTQVRPAEGTLASSPVDFTIGTYFGSDADIAELTIESEPVVESEPVIEQSVVSNPLCKLTGSVTDAQGNGVAGVDVSLTSGGKAVATLRTDAQGRFGFEGLSSGEYVLSASASEAVTLLSGDGYTVSQDGKTATTQPLALADSQELLLTLYAKQSCSVSGTATENGAPVAGVSLTLTDSAGATRQQITDENGRYLFADLEPTTATLSVVAPSGMMPVTLGGEAVTADSGYARALSIESGKALALDVDLQRGASIYGGSAALDEGAQIVATSGSNSLSAVTGADGMFRFDGLSAGEYSIYVPVPQGKALDAASMWQLTQQGDKCWASVSVSAGESKELPALTLATYASIEGYAYLDESGDGACAEDEPLLEGVPLTLQRKVGDSWIDVESVKTNVYGKYAFSQLATGEYRVISQTDAEGFYVASVGAGAQLDESGALCGAIIALGDGEHSADAANIGLQRSSSLTFTAFVDQNENGVRENGEAAVASAKVEVLNGDSAIAIGQTDAGGVLTLASVIPGEHALRITSPAGYAFTVKGADSCVGGVSESVAVSDPIAFASGQAVATGVGLSPVGSFSGKVFEDVNDDGVMQDDEPGVAGVLLRLEGKRSGAVYELTSDETGLYCFNNLPSDSYTFTATLPEGMLYARYSKTGGDLRSVFSGSTTERQFTVSKTNPAVNKNVGVIERGNVAGAAFTDLNYNGVWDDGEPGYEGLTLELIRIYNSESAGKTVTDANGEYHIDGLRGADYRLRAILPDDGVSQFTVVASGEKANPFVQREGRRENSVQPVVITSGITAHVYIGVAIGAKIEGVVYLDEDYSGAQNGKEKLLSGIKVQLVDMQGAVVTTDTTNASGQYTLSGIMPGSYVVQVQRKANYGFTRLRPDEERGNCVVELLGEYGLTNPIEVTMGQVIGNINAGMLPSATVSGTLFHDADDDGLRGEGENGLTSVKARLLSDDGEIDLTREVAEDGSYFFDGVMPGSYTVTYTLPEHAEMALVAEGGNTLSEPVTQPFVVVMGEEHLLPPVGVVTLGSFEGYVFHDVDASGVAEDGEERVSGAVVTLAPKRAGLEAQSATTGDDGAFSITQLRPSDYELTVKLPDGYILSHSLDADSITLKAANEDTAACAWAALINRAPKAIGAVKPATVSGAIWLDENKDATRGDETLLGNVTVELVNSATGFTAQRVNSGEQGYVFDAVRPGRYKLRFSMPAQSEPAGEKDAAFTFTGGYMICDGVSVAEGETVSGLDAGVVSRTSVGGRVWLEENGASSPVPNVTISLYMAGQSDALMTATTSESGSYRFDGLWPGDYSLTASLPEGMIFVRPDDGNYQPDASMIVSTDENGGASDVFAVQMARHQLYQNIIFIKPAKIGDQAWLDENGNGLIDADEPMLSGVTVRLLKDGQAVYETQTDAYGYYEFKDVYPDTYTLQAAAYPQLAITKVVPKLKLISSCLVSGDGTDALSDPFEAKSGESNMDFNLGYVLLDGQTLPQLEQPTQKDWTGSNTPYVPEK